MRFRRVIATVMMAGAAAGASAAPPTELLQELVEQQRALWESGRIEESEAVLLQVRSLADRYGLQRVELGAAYHLARTAARRGEPELAVERLREAIAMGFDGWRDLAGDPALEPLRRTGALEPLIRELHEADHVAWAYEPYVTPLHHRYDSPATPQLVALVREQGLGEAVAGAADDLERVAALAGWTHRAFAHDGAREPAPGRGDPLSLVTAGAAGERFRCVEFAVVAAGAARALGLPARRVVVTIAEVETTPAEAGHVVAEVWLPDRGRWAVADGQFGVVPVLDGEPLSVVELRQAIWKNAPVTCLGQGAERCGEWVSWIYPYLYHVLVDEDQRLYEGDQPTRRVMLVPDGAPRPRRFQGMEAPYRNVEYTSDPHVLYPAETRQARSEREPETPRVTYSYWAGRG